MLISASRSSNAWRSFRIDPFAYVSDVLQPISRHRNCRVATTLRTTRRLPLEKSAVVRPASLGAISGTSRSPVGRENPYTMVTTNPPMQSSRTSSCTAESNSRRNESHGSGMLSLGCVGKVFSLRLQKLLKHSSQVGRHVIVPPSFFVYSWRTKYLTSSLACLAVRTCRWHSHAECSARSSQRSFEACPRVATYPSARSLSPQRPCDKYRRQQCRYRRDHR